jgi:hypothetical protein
LKVTAVLDDFLAAMEFLETGIKENGWRLKNLQRRKGPGHPAALALKGL